MWGRGGKQRLKTIESNDMNTPVEFEESKKKLYLVALDPGRKRLIGADKVFCYASAKYRLIYFGKPAVDAMGLSNAWYKLAYDSDANTIAWKIRKELFNDQLQESGWKFCKGTDASGKVAIGIGRILDTFRGLKKDTYKNLEIKKWKDKGLVGDGDDMNTWYFVQLNDTEQDNNDKE